MDNTVNTFENDEKDLAVLRKKLKKEQLKIRLHSFTKNKMSVIGLIITVIMLLIAIFAPLIAAQDPYLIQPAKRLKAPSAQNWFGTDDMGRDVFSRVIYGARISLFVGFTASVLSGIIGMIIGIYSSYNSFLDNLFMRICDGLKAIPSTLLAICLMAFLGPSVRNVIIALTVVSAPGIARMARAQAMVVKEQTYVEAMHCLGGSTARILWKHIAPNTLSPVIVQMTFVFASAILTEAALSFLGAGVPAGTPSWGSILTIGRNHIFTSWWLIAFPGIFTALTVLGLNLLGDGIRDLLDPLTN